MAKIVESTNTNCLIGEGSVFEGKFHVVGSIRIEGKFQGDIKTDDQLIIAPSGKVKTDIIAKRVTVAGTLIGNITASEEVNLLESGKVLGNITTPRLNVEPGVITDGKVSITSNSSSEISTIIKDSYGEDTKNVFATFEKPEKSRKPDDHKLNA
ncbi:MAG: polymer-forming cytoskeletal family protein [Spirochaetales bacterium]|nr:MAG: polymer-forming cytoskeletal family protein [Spirochaetales bacterium]